METHLSSRDWAIEQLREHYGVLSIEAYDNYFARIDRKEYAPFTTAITSEQNVLRPVVEDLIAIGDDFHFVTNIPKGAVWSGDAIAAAREHNLGWGGFGDLMSAIGVEAVRNFQRKEYSFVERGLCQYSRVCGLTRLDDRIFQIHRRELCDIKIALINEYELTADHVRHVREVYCDFDAILKTNPNGRTTRFAREVADQLEV